MAHLRHTLGLLPAPAGCSPVRWPHHLQTSEARCARRPRGRRDAGLSGSLTHFGCPGPTKPYGSHRPGTTRIVLVSVTRNAAPSGSRPHGPAERQAAPGHTPGPSLVAWDATGALS